jgi:hypothetical protein
LKTLNTWQCDICHKEITTADDAQVVWKTDDNFRASAFKIVHNKIDCDLKEHHKSAHLDDFLGHDGLAYIFSKLSLGPIKTTNGETPFMEVKDIENFIDFARRVQTPYYEEARQKFSTPEVLSKYSDSDEVAPYEQATLKEIFNT